MAEFAAPASEPGRSLEAAARDRRRSGSEAASLRRAARAGLAGASAPYPHGDRIRRAFGQYAPAGLRAHMGPAAMAAAGRMNAAAFVLDGEAAFAARPSLHTAAHEAAHLAHHERGGAALRHGVGALGDRHEALADRVADAVAAGRSAEPLLAASLPASPGPAGPMLQMAYNSISSQTYTTPPSPWTEIQNQLPFTDPKAANKLVRDVPVEALKGPFNRMVATLKDSCDRAGSVTADIIGARNGGARAGDATQTAYGTLGKLEGYLNEAMPGPKENYEGGHLVSDQILGVDSYVQFNFAPQQRPFNSPFYRAIEKIGFYGLGLKASPASPSPTATPDITYKATVRYPTSNYTVKRPDLERLLDYAKYLGPKPSTDPSPITLPVYKAGQALPASVSLTPRVPSLWTVKVSTTSPDHDFKHQATVTKNKDMHKAFEPKGEAHVAGLVSPSGDYTGDIRWAMDTMTVANPKAGKSFGTTSGGSHTFTAVQAPPRNPAASSGSSSVSSTVPSVPTTVGGPPPSSLPPSSLPAPSLTPPGPTPGTGGPPPPTGPTSGGPSPSMVSLAPSSSLITPSVPSGPPPSQTQPGLSMAHSLLASYSPSPKPSGPPPTLTSPGTGSAPQSVKPPPSMAQSLLDSEGPIILPKLNFGPGSFAPKPSPSQGFGGSQGSSHSGPPSFAAPPPTYSPGYGVMAPMYYPPYGMPMGGFYGGGMMGLGYGGPPMGFGFGGPPMGFGAPYKPPPLPPPQQLVLPPRRQNAKRDRDPTNDPVYKKHRGREDDDQ